MENEYHIKKDEVDGDDNNKSKKQIHTLFTFIHTGRSQKLEIRRETAVTIGKKKHIYDFAHAIKKRKSDTKTIKTIKKEREIV